MVATLAKPHADFVLLGTVVRPHGVRGELKVRPWTESVSNFCRYQHLYLAAEAGEQMVLCTDVQARVSADLVILRIGQCRDRDQAEQLVGQHLWLPVEDLPPVQEGEWYLHSLMGRQAKTTEGRVLGRIQGVLNSPGQDLLVIVDGGREHLIPAVHDFVVAVEEDEVLLDLPPGLLDINR